MSDRMDYLNRALTGRFNPLMLSVKTDWDMRTGDTSFTRLGCLRFALTRWSFCFNNGHIFFLPYGGWHWHISKKLIHINIILFSIYIFKREKQQ